MDADVREGPGAREVSTKPEFTDILVRTASPELLDTTVQQLGPAVVAGAPDYVMVEGCYVVRVYGNPGYIKWAIAKQGYGEVVRELEEPL